MAMEVNVQISNNASGSLKAGISDSATSLQLQVGEGSEFPTITGSQYFYTTITNVSGDIEIVKVTATSGDQFTTIVRSQDGTTAQAWLAGDIVSLRPVTALFEDMVSEMNTGTPSTSFQIDDDNTGPIIKNNSGSLEVKNEADSDYADLYANDLFAYEGTNDFIQLDVSAGVIEICDSGANAAIDFKSAAAEDFDCRIIQVSDGLGFYTGGNGSTALVVTLDSSQVATFEGDLKTKEDLVIDSDNTGPRLRNNSGVMEVRNNGDSAYASLTVSDLIAYTDANNFIKLASAGTLSICDSAATPALRFLTAGSEVADCEVSQLSNGLQLRTGGDGAISTALTLNSSQNATFAGTINSGAITSTGALVGTSLNAGSGTIQTTGTMVTGDHGTASTGQIVNVCYGTGLKPTASTTTIGTLFIKYTA